MSALVDVLVRASLAGAPFALLALAATRLLPRLPPALRAGLVWLACARFLVALAPLPAVELRVLPAAPQAAPLLLVPAPSPHQAPSRSQTQSPSPSLSPPPSPSQSPSLSPSPSPPPPTPGVRDVLGALWLLGAAAAAVRLARGARAVRGLVARATPLAPGHPAHAALAALGRSTRLRLPRLARSPEIRAPLCAGLLDPVILLPDLPLPARALRLALAHELGHLRRLDLWLAWAPALAEIALWFHPLVRLAARELAQAREEACDALALELTGDAPADYGPLLVAFGTGHPRLALAAAAGAPHVRQLERRLRMLSSHGTKAARSARWLGAAVLAAVTPALVPFALAEAPAAPAAPPAVAPAPVAPVAAPAPVAPVAPPARVSASASSGGAGGSSGAGRAAGPGRSSGAGRAYAAAAAPLPPAPPAPPRLAQAGPRRRPRRRRPRRRWTTASSWSCATGAPRSSRTARASTSAPRTASCT
ncbi:MAG: M56 family metallopeptidase [Anaeromyxobacter sp.]